MFTTVIYQTIYSYLQSQLAQQSNNIHNKSQIISDLTKQPQIQQTCMLEIHSVLVDWHNNPVSLIHLRMIHLRCFHKDAITLFLFPLPNNFQPKY